MSSTCLWFENEGGVAHAFSVENDGTVAQTSVCTCATDEQCDTYVEKPKKVCRECTLRLFRLQPEAQA